MFSGLSFGKNLTLGMNPAIKAFVLSEVLLWSGWNLLAPIFSIFVIKDIPGADIGTAAYAFTGYLLTRMVVELYVSRKIASFSTAQRAIFDVIGMVILSLAYLDLATRPTIADVYIFYIVIGIGFGISSPAKNSLFSRNLERTTETRVWGVYDVAILSGMAVATSIGGFIADRYGFKAVLLASAAINILGTMPYLFFLRYYRHQRPDSG